MDQFTTALLAQLDKAEKEQGIRQPQLRRSVERYGGISAMQELIRRGRISDGFDALCQKKLLALSAEALVISKEYHALFTDEEVNACFELLCGANYFYR